MKYLHEAEDWNPCISLETADPAKFPEEIIRLINVNPPLPPALAQLDQLEEHFELIDGSYGSLKSYLERIE